jgi:hypothetical protein
MAGGFPKAPALLAACCARCCTAPLCSLISQVASTYFRLSPRSLSGFPPSFLHSLFPRPSVLPLEFPLIPLYRGRLLVISLCIASAYTSPFPLCIYPLGRPAILLRVSLLYSRGIPTSVSSLTRPHLLSSTPFPYRDPDILRSPVSVESLSRLQTADPSSGPIDFSAVLTSGSSASLTTSQLIFLGGHI